MHVVSIVIKYLQEKLRRNILKHKIILYFSLLIFISCGGGGKSSTASPTVSSQVVVSSQVSPTTNNVDFDNEKSKFESSTEYINQSGLKLIKSSSAYARGATGKDVLVGVMDTGVDYLHQELNGINKFRTIYTTYPEDLPPTTDQKRHGTHVAAIISGEMDGSGIHGVAFNSEILFIEIKLGTASETYDPVEIDPTIDFTGYDNFQSYYQNIFIDEGVNVVNGSFGFQGNITDYLEENLRYAFPKTIGVMAQQNTPDKDKTIFVWSAGNAGAYADQGVDYSNPEVFAGMAYLIPELQGHTVAVVSVDDSGEISSFSSRCGVSQDYCMAAPGRSIYSAYSQDSPVFDDYQSFSGTSMAAPHVTGGIALLVDYFRNQLGGTEILDRLFKTANKSGIYSDASIYGQGLLDLDAATKPVGQMMVATSSSLDKDLIPKSQSMISFSGLLGQKIINAFSGKSVVFFDELGAPFYRPLDSIIINHRPSIGWLSRRYLSATQRIERARRSISNELELSIDYLRNSLDIENYGPRLWVTEETTLRAFSVLKVIGSTSYFFAGHGKSPSEYFNYYSGKQNRVSSYMDLEDFSSPYLEFTSSGSFLGGGINISNNSSLGLTIVNGSLDLQENFYPGPKSAGYILEFKKRFKRGSLSIVSGQLTENSGLLGTSFGGAFDVLGKSITLFKGLTTSANFYEYKFMTSMYLGNTKGRFSDASLIKSSDNIFSSAYTIGLFKDNLFQKNDSFGLLFSQPLFVNKGSFYLRTPIGRTKSREVFFKTFEIDLDSIQKKKDVKIIYTINNSSYSISAKLHFALNKKAILNERDKGFGEIIWQKNF